MSDLDVRKIQKLFGQCVREIRLSKGLSQEALALNCNLDRSYIGQVERGEKNISLINIYRIATGLGVQPSELLVGTKKSARIKEAS